VHEERRARKILPAVVEARYDLDGDLIDLEVWWRRIDGHSAESRSRTAAGVRVKYWVDRWFLPLETRYRGLRWMWTFTFRAWSSVRSAVVCSRRRRDVAAAGRDRKQRRLRPRPTAPKAAGRASAYPHSSPAVAVITV